MKDYSAAPVFSAVNYLSTAEVAESAEGFEGWLYHGLLANGLFVIELQKLRSMFHLLKPTVTSCFQPFPTLKFSPSCWPSLCF
jgi:hypothetical protein